MRLLNRILLVGLTLVVFNIPTMGQIDTKQNVIAAAGSDTVLDNGLYIAYTVGEMAISSGYIEDYVFTEGFHQTEGLLLPPLLVNSSSTEAQCPDVPDGTIIVSPQGCRGPYKVLVTSSNGTYEADVLSGSITFRDLDSGTYYITVRGITLCAYTDTARVELKNSDCDIEYYSGITPNGDGKNDFWEIDNIEINQPNSVQVFNRWGNVVWRMDNYNNRDKSWKGDNMDGSPLPSGTYFYVIEVSGNSSASGSGWIQLTR